MKRYFTLFFLLITSIALCAYPEGAINNIDGSALGWDETNKVWRPIAVDATGKLSSEDSTTVQEISVDTSNIETYLKKVDGENTVTISDLINGIGTDTKDIKTDVASISSNMTNSITDILKYLFSKTIVSTTTIYDLVNSIRASMSSISTDNFQIKSNVYSIEKAVKIIQGGTVPTFWATTRKSITPNTATLLGNLSSNLNVAIAYDMGRVFIEIRATDPDAEFYIGFGDDIDDTTGRPVKGRILLNAQQDCNVYIYHTGASALAIQQTEGWSQSTL